jgi:hypothetical protein
VTVDGPNALTVDESYALTVDEPNAVTVDESYALTVDESHTSKMPGPVIHTSSKEVRLERASVSLACVVHL